MVFRSLYFFVQRFGSLQSEGVPFQAFSSSTDLSIGGNKQTGSVIGSLSGIVNRMWFSNAYLSDLAFSSAFAYPSKS
jgi:hypothetical protein